MRSSYNILFFTGVIFVMVLCPETNRAQSVGINTLTPAAGSILDIRSTNRGVLLPRITLSNITSVNPINQAQYMPAGTLVYNINENVNGGNGSGFYYWGNYYTGTQRWIKLETSTDNFWKLTGNAGTNPATHFIGNLYDYDMNFVRNGIPVATLGANNTLMGVTIAYPIVGFGTYNSLIGKNYVDNKRTTASYNTCAGASQFENGTTFSYNTAAGRGALYDNVSGGRNTAIGGWSSDYAKGSNNITIGYDATVSTYDSFSMAIGYSAVVAPNGQQLVKNAVAIGADATSRYHNALCFGDLRGSRGAVRVGIGLTNPLTDLDIKQNSGTFSTAGIKLTHSAGVYNYRMFTDASWDFNWYRNGSLRSYIEDGTGNYIVSSDSRLKKDITAFTHVMPLLMQLKPKTYRFKEQASDEPLVYGFLAQEVESVFPDFVTTQSDSGIKAISYQNFYVLAVQAIKEQQVMIEEKTRKIDDLFRRLEALESAGK